MGFLLVLALVLSQGPRQAEAQQNQSVSGQVQRGTEKAPIVIKEDSSERAGQARQYQQERRDKQATDGALVRYTKYLFIATVSLTLFTTALWLATWALVRGAEETAKRQLRAYVHVDELLADYGPITATSIPMLTIVVKNFGQTPAYRLRIWTDTKVDTASNPTTLALSERLTTGSIHTLGPGGVMRHLTDALTVAPAQSAGVSNGTLRMFLIGTIQYVDAFGDFRRETFRQSVNVKNMTMEIDNDGNDSFVEPKRLSLRQRVGKWIAGPG